MTKFQYWAKMLDTLTSVSDEEKAHFFAMFTNKPLDRDEMAWYNEYRK